MSFPTEFQREVAKHFIYTDLTLDQVGSLFGVSLHSVRKWALEYDPELYQIATGRTRALLMAQEILESLPNIRAQELADMVNVTRTTIILWQNQGLIELDIQCEICGETTTTKYCQECRDKGWVPLVYKYGLTHDQLKTLPTACEICGKEGNLHVDHNHETGKYRGVLCHGCNTSLGLVNENIMTLIKMIKYIKTR